MKRTLLFLVVVSTIAIMTCCKPGCQKPNELVGKWQRSDVDTISLVLELTENNEWKYSKNEELLEEGTFKIEENIFIMKHAVEEHNHDHDGDHEHAHPEDHKYEFSLNEDKTELSFINEGKKSTYKKI